MPIEETPGGLGNAGYISGKAVEREQARLAREAAARVPSIPTGSVHMAAPEDSITCPVSPRPFPSQITDDPHAVTCAHCLKIMNEDARS